MDTQSLANLVGAKHQLDIDPTDPLILVATMVEALTKEAQDRLAKVVTDAADQNATAAVLAENAARIRSERIVTEAAKWSSEQIRLAGADAAKIVVERLEDLVKQTQGSARRATVAAWTSAACAGGAAAILAIIFLH